MQFNNMTHVMKLNDLGLIVGDIGGNTTVIEYMKRGLNYTELKNYIEFRINMEDINNGNITYHNYDFKKCT